MATNFGRDISCTDSLRTGRFVSGVRLVAEAAYRRLITPRGTLRGGEEEENYGFDLSSLIGSVVTASDAAALEGRIANELLKDERISTVTAVVTMTKRGPSTFFDVDVSATTAEGPFTLQLSVTDVTVELLGIAA